MMKRNLTCSKLLLGFSLCMAFLFTAGLHKETRVHAASISGKYADTTIYGQKYMEQCCPGIKSLGEIYITGGSEEPKYTDRITIWPVPYDTKIQGQTIEKKYLPHGNIENLQEIFSSVIGYREFEWITGEYQEGGGAKYQVVAYDDRNVIFWSNGYKAFPESPAMCHQSDIMMSHPPGFYMIPKGQVWMNLDSNYNAYNKFDNYDKDGNAIVNYVAKGKVTKNYLGICTLPGVVSTGDVYRVKNNTELYVVSTQKVTLKGESIPYYKVAFRATNHTYYMSKWGYFYVQSRYINLYRNGVKVPDNLTDGKIVDSYAHDINVYKEPKTSSTVLGYVQKDTEIQYYEQDSNSTWSKVWYNSGEAYIQTKYLQKVNKPAVEQPKPAPSKVSVKTIKNNQYVMTWNKPSGCQDYKIILTKNPLSTAKKNIVYQNNHYKSNVFTVKNSWLKKNTKTGLYLLVSANYSHGTSTSTRSDLIYMASKPKALKKKQLKISKKSIKFVKYYTDMAKLQYSTNKSFKKAKTVKAKNGIVKSISKLKPKTTYYIRYSTSDYVDTNSGGKMVYSDWSKALKVKTKK